MVWHDDVKKPSRSETKSLWPRSSAESALPVQAGQIGIISHTGKLAGKMWRSTLNGNDRQRPAPSLRELYSKPRRSNAWESEGVDVIRFWTDDEVRKHGRRPAEIGTWSQAFSRCPGQVIAERRRKPIPPWQILA